jgi:diguanylate cyclase (GGDEF)-like protein/PAS domain S-box-containing protein
MDERDAALRFFDLTANVALVVAFDGTILHANRAFAAAAGGDLRGESARDVVHPADVAVLRRSRHRLLRERAEHDTFDVRLGSDAHGWRWHRLTAAIDDGAGTFHAIGQDRTEALDSAARLAEAEDRFRAAFEDAAIGMAITSLDGRWLRVNPAMCALLERPEEELVGRPVLAVVHPDDQPLALAAQEAMRTGERLTTMDEKRYVRPDGSVVWVLRSGSLVRDGEAPAYFISQAIDVTRRRHAQEALRASEERFRALAGAAPSGVWSTDLFDACVYANDRLAAIAGCSPQELLGYGWVDVFGGEEGFEGADRVRRQLLDAGNAGHEFPIATRDGRMVWVRGRAAVLHGSDGGASGVVGSLEDVTDEVANRRELALREQELRLLTERSSDFLARLSPALEVRYASPACVPLIGRTPQELMGRRVDDLVVPEDRAILHDAAARLVTEDSVTVVCRVRRSDERIVWFESSIAPIRDAAGAIAELVLVSRDVTERKAAELQLAHQAMHDALTGLPNRALFLDRLAHALRRRVRRGTGVLAVMFLDVDRFKVINDSLGHGAGDLLLIDVAGRLDAALRPSDTVARFGGDEFTVLCEDINGELEAVAIAQRIVDLFEEPFDIDGREVFLSTSVGISLASEVRSDGSGAADLIRDADAAMYRAKELGKARYELFDAAMREHALRRLELENALRRAVEREELRIHLQPEIAVAGGAVVGFEALVRWQHPERGLLAPAEFVPLAEETGLIASIGEWVLRRACAEAAGWTASELSIAVNVSPRQLLQGDFVQLVATVLAQTGLRPERLCLELTESAVIESGPETLATLQGLKRLGVMLAIDDFGTGWSSLGHLRRFPLDVLKLDRSFVTGLGSAPQDASIAAAIISLAHALGLSTVAEGIETAEQLAMLTSLGCDLGQGYLFAKPAPAETFAGILAA